MTEGTDEDRAVEQEAADRDAQEAIDAAARTEQQQREAQEAAQAAQAHEQEVGQEDEAVRDALKAAAEKDAAAYTRTLEV